jgi:hypothetical protein
MVQVPGSHHWRVLVELSLLTKVVDACPIGDAVTCLTFNFVSKSTTPAVLHGFFSNEQIEPSTVDSNFISPSSLSTLPFLSKKHPELLLLSAYRNLAKSSAPHFYHHA